MALLADSALSAAIGTTLPAGTAFASVDLKVNYLRPLASDGREATARGTVLHSGRRVAVASAPIGIAPCGPHSHSLRGMSNTALPRPTSTSRVPNIWAIGGRGL